MRLDTARAVPFVSLSPVNAAVAEMLLADLERLIESSAFTNGLAVTEFERAFAAYCGTEHCVGVASGLDALRLALLAEGIEQGDEVIVPANTFAATLEAVIQAGATPVLVDAHVEDFNLDPTAVDAAVTVRTRFVVPVHLYGQMADLGALPAVTIVEDACQAHGAMRDGRKAGSVGQAAAFSFYPAKNLGAFGDAGGLTTDDADLAGRVRALREHGQYGKYEHELVGYTARLDTIQALVLLRKLPLLDRWNEERRAAARTYAALLRGVGDLQLPAVSEGSEPVWHLYVVRTSDPDGLAAFLRDRGIGTGRHYPQPLHLAPAYAHLGYRQGEFPVTERLATEVLSLPLFPGITDTQLEAVAAAIEDYFRGG
jgi:dTDP-4-amino-4,6-dideoxygalactose transaminase